MKGKLKHPDHYALHLALKNIPMKNKTFIPNPKEIVWNTKKKEGWKYFREMTDNNEKLNRVANNEETSPEIILK